MVIKDAPVVNPENILAKNLINIPAIIPVTIPVTIPVKIPAHIPANLVKIPAKSSQKGLTFS